jgi:hypothetical protein
MTVHGFTTNRAPGARPALTFSTVEEAHTGLIERLSVLKPYRILYIADAQDLEERAEHLRRVLGAVLDYVGAIVVDTSHAAPGGSIDRKYLVGLISDLASDVAGSIANAADDPHSFAPLTVRPSTAARADEIVVTICSCSLRKSTQETITRCRRRTGSPSNFSRNT